MSKLPDEVDRVLQSIHRPHEILLRRHITKLTADLAFEKKIVDMMTESILRDNMTTCGLCINRRENAICSIDSHRTPEDCMAGIRAYFENQVRKEE